MNMDANEPVDMGAIREASFLISMIKSEEISLMERQQAVVGEGNKPFEDFYATLGFSTDQVSQITPQDIAQATLTYLKKVESLKHDKLPQEDQERLQRLLTSGKRAFTVLSNPQERKKYDEARKNRIANPVSK